VPIVFALPLVRRHRRGGVEVGGGNFGVNVTARVTFPGPTPGPAPVPIIALVPPPSSAADRPRSPRVRAPHPPQRPAWSSPPVVVIGVIVVRRLVSVDTSSTSRVSLLSLAPQAVRQPPSWSTEGESIALITHRDREIARKRNGL
jgi:hypothetical protein